MPVSPAEQVPGTYGHETGEQNAETENGRIRPLKRSNNHENHHESEQTCAESGRKNGC
jgi:hypothetical protein